MPTLSSFDYAIVRVVPHVEREEFINVGVILFCRTQRFLEAQIELDCDRLTALAPQIDLAMVPDHLALIPRTCAGDDSAIGRLSQPERFHWLVTPRSTTIQVSPVHSGLCSNPKQALEHLVRSLVSSAKA
jgi:hypothetical protein